SSLWCCKSRKFSTRSATPRIQRGLRWEEFSDCSNDGRLNVAAQKLPYFRTNIAVFHERFAHQNRARAAPRDPLDIGGRVNAALGDQQGRGWRMEDGGWIGGLCHLPSSIFHPLCQSFRRRQIHL